MIRTPRFPRAPRVLLLLATLGLLVAINAVIFATRSASPLTDAPIAGCPPADPSRDHFFPPVPDVTPPPPATGDRPELAEMTWVGWAKPMTVDFTKALLLGNEEYARTFLAPGYDPDFPALRRRLGIACPPDTFTAHWARVSTDQAEVEPTLYYAETTVTVRVILRPYPDQWRIVAVEPAAPRR